MIEGPSSTGHGFPGEEDREDQWLDMSNPLSPQIITKSCQPSADQLIVDNDTGFVQKDNDSCVNSQPINSHGTIYVLGEDGFACMGVNGLFTGLTGTPVSEFLCYNEQDGYYPPIGTSTAQVRAQLGTRNTYSSLHSPYNITHQLSLIHI